MKLDDKAVVTDVYVIKGLSRPLHSMGVIEHLGIVKRLKKIEDLKTDQKKKWAEIYPKIFSGLGLIKCKPCKIAMKPDAIPFSLMVPRRVPLPLHDKVKEELERLVKLGVIVPVTKVTDWCSAMVCIPKASGSARITADMSKLNEWVRRERYDLPVVSDTLAGFAGAKNFSLLDANSGFFQIRLDEESQDLTTFITPFGRYQYLRCLMGISSLPEVFSREMARILAGLEGVKNLMAYPYKKIDCMYWRLKLHLQHLPG